ncbi:hypothetical protein LTR86_002546 [Recurvomyces mirabilis]|nr:hypothetical protein LTR86_002546 [Recurvomyces mirabilis]
MACFSSIQKKTKRVLAAVKSAKNSSNAKTTTAAKTRTPTSTGFKVVSGRRLERPEWIQSAMAGLHVPLSSQARGGRDAKVSRATSVDAREVAVAVAGAEHDLAAVSVAWREGRKEDRWEVLPGDEVLLDEDILPGGRMMPAFTAADDEEGTRHDSVVVGVAGSDGSRMTPSPGPEAWWAKVANYSSTHSFTSSSSASSAGEETSSPSSSSQASSDSFVHLPVTEPVRIPTHSSSSLRPGMWMQGSVVSPTVLSPQQLESVASLSSPHQVEVEMAAVPKARVETKAKSRYRQTRFVEDGLVDEPVET